MTGPPPSVVELLQALVAIPSVNPEAEAAAGSDLTGEAEIATYVGAFLRWIGAEIDFDEVAPNRPNVIGRFPHGGSGGVRGGVPVVALAPHTDTVTVRGMTIDPFAGTVRDGKLYGRGACDTKGTMAAMLWALKELGPERLARLNCEVWFVGLVGEERLQLGSKDFGNRYAGSVSFALVGEPTGCQTVARTKGAAWPTLTATGTAAHGSRPELGDNAIVKMARALSAVDAEFKELLKNEKWVDPLLGHSTVNIGTVSGGELTNIVAGRCEATLDLRMTPAFYRDGGVELLRRFLDRGGYGVVLEADSPSPPLDTPLDNPFVRVLGSIGSAPAGAPWFCDASWLSEAGIPSVAAGPGSIDQAHTVDEWIETAELERGVAFYRHFLERC